jgi:exopolysaccharide biosynthesis WecB/TagA/CpsF family protein
MTADLGLLLDLASLFLAASLSALLYVYWLPTLGLTFVSGGSFEHAGWITALLVPVILYDKRFAAVASREQMSALVRSYLLRFSAFAGAVLTFGGFFQAADMSSPERVVILLATILLAIVTVRLLMTLLLRRLQRQGVITEVIAIVGVGPVADRLVHTLHQAKPKAVEVLGVFDDKVIGAAPSEIKSSGNIDKLIELGKARKIDWILLTLPPTAEQRLLSIVGRLKALSVPIGLCPQHVGLAPYRSIDYVGDGIPVSMLADQPMQRWDAIIETERKFLPRWLVTWALLPPTILAVLAERLAKAIPAVRNLDPYKRADKLTFEFDNYDTESFADVAAAFGKNRYGYVVTPNADHLIRLRDDGLFRSHYAAANYVLLDSRFLSHVLRLAKGIRLPVCTGSDLTAKLFSEVIVPDDSLVLIGGSHEQASKLRERYGLRQLAHFNPPMGFIHDVAAVEACLHFIESHSPFRFCLLAVGAPQQEMIAQQLKARGIARGLALCIGASINFLTGDERRAPLWMQRCGTEWCFRLCQAPKRMAKRYLVRGPRVFGLLRRADIVLRRPATSRLRLVSAHQQPTLQDSPPASTYAPARVAHAEREDRTAQA